MWVDLICVSSITELGRRVHFEIRYGKYILLPSIFLFFLSVFSLFLFSLPLSLSLPPENLLPQRLHLPPDLSDTVSRSSKQDLAESAKLLSSGCGAMAIGKKHLDF